MLSAFQLRLRLIHSVALLSRWPFLHTRRNSPRDVDPGSQSAQGKASASPVLPGSGAPAPPASLDLLASPLLHGSYSLSSHSLWLPPVSSLQPEQNGLEIKASSSALPSAVAPGCLSCLIRLGPHHPCTCLQPGALLLFPSRSQPYSSLSTKPTWSSRSASQAHLVMAVVTVAINMD